MDIRQATLSVLAAGKSRRHRQPFPVAMATSLTVHQILAGIPQML